jgi:hypothetical protein
LLRGSSIALYMLSSIIVDRAEPSEALTATVVWSEGIQDANILLSSRHIDDFRKGRRVKSEPDVRAERGAYLLNADLIIEAGSEKTWYIVSDVNKDAGQIALLNHLLKENKNIAGLLQKDISDCTDELIKIIVKCFLQYYAWRYF